MKKKKVIILFLQLLVIVGFSISFYAYVQKEINPVPVYVFNKNMDVNTVLTAADMKQVEVPAKAVSPQFVRDLKEIEGKYLASKAFSGQYVYKDMMIEKDDVNPFESMDLSKYRKISMPINLVEGLAGNLQKGDKVDLVFTGQGEKDKGAASETFLYSKVFLQDVYVYSVSTEEGFAFTDKSDITKSEAISGPTNGQEISTDDASDKLAVLTLAVTLNEAEEITTRMKSGQVKILGRFEDSKSYQSVGFVLGDYSKIFSGNANAETGKPVLKPVQ